MSLDGETSNKLEREQSGSLYLFDLLSVAFIQPKHLDGKHFSVFIRGLPNIGESTGGNSVLAYREGHLYFVGSWEESVYLASPALFSDTSLVEI